MPTHHSHSTIVRQSLSSCCTVARAVVFLTVLRCSSWLITFLNVSSMVYCFADLLMMMFQRSYLVLVRDSVPWPPLRQRQPCLCNWDIQTSPHKHTETGKAELTTTKSWTFSDTCFICDCYNFVILIQSTELSTLKSQRDCSMLVTEHSTFHSAESLTRALFN